MSDGAVPRKNPVPITPPILGTRFRWAGEADSVKGRSPDHSDMTTLQLALESHMNLGR